MNKIIFKAEKSRLEELFFEWQRIAFEWVSRRSKKQRVDWLTWLSGNVISKVGVQGSKSLLSRGVGRCVFVVLKISRMRGCYAVSGRSRGVRTVRQLQRRSGENSGARRWVGDREFGFDVRDSVLLSVSLILEFDGELLCPDGHHVYCPGKIQRRFVQMS
ncbi:hypothetical protein L6452_15643 [Arctium lappa]|uniref:Uncharacterized protein n=1 Tax=Arctium lappa TaxID=4217 RepID=A0ACB9CPC1_ARCLA|nr:hypothetical protein L6452_15643 [Arctium lappa]